MRCGCFGAAEVGAAFDADAADDDAADAEVGTEAAVGTEPVAPAFAVEVGAEGIVEAVGGAVAAVAVRSADAFGAAMRSAVGSGASAADADADAVVDTIAAAGVSDSMRNDSSPAATNADGEIGASAGAVGDSTEIDRPVSGWYGGKYWYWWWRW